MKHLRHFSIGERIALARDRYQLSQSQLAANLGVTRAAISLYEQDKIRPRQEVVERLAAMFNTKPAWFEQGRGRSPRALDAPLSITEVNVERLTSKILDLRDLPTGRRWQVPTEMFADAKLSPDDLLMIRAPNYAYPIHLGDRVVINTQGLDPADAIFLVVDAVGARLRRYEPGCAEVVRVYGQAVAYFRTL